MCVYVHMRVRVCGFVYVYVCVCKRAHAHVTLHQVFRLAKIKAGKAVGHSAQASGRMSVLLVSMCSDAVLF